MKKSKSFDLKKHYIDRYLTPKSKLGNYGKNINVLKNDELINRYEVKNILIKLSYDDFLRTGYWKIISNRIKDKHNKCNICGSQNYLQVHHNTYDIHGMEVYHMDELRVLCSSCHSQIHHQV